MVVQEEPVLHIAVTLPAGITFWGKVWEDRFMGFMMLGIPWMRAQRPLLMAFVYRRDNGVLQTYGILEDF